MKIYHEGILEWKYAPLDRVDPPVQRRRQSSSDNDYLSYAVRLHAFSLKKGNRNMISATTPSNWVLKYDQSFG